MTLRPIAAVAIGWLGLCGGAQAQSAPTLPLAGSVETATPTTIAYGRHWNTAPCVPQRTTVAITQPPAHGTVRVIEERTDVPPATLRTGSTGYCAGTLLFGQKIVYESKPGFAGTDTLSYESIGPDGRRLPYTVTLTVAPSE